MRKYEKRWRKALEQVGLQCGRIYKDAEIHAKARLIALCGGQLQCGRIYKDAEIPWRAVGCARLLSCFNVAASIKMRKCYQAGENGKPDKELQCGRIYKDAEIRSRPEPRCRPRSRLQCGRIYKDAEMEIVQQEGHGAEACFNVAASIKMRK